MTKCRLGPSGLVAVENCRFLRVREQGSWWDLSATNSVIPRYFGLKAKLCESAALSSCYLPMAPPQPAGNSGPWELEDSGSTAGLRGVHAVGGGVVWASGTGGTVLRSEDAGYLWQQCATPPDANKLDFRGIWAWDAQNALLLSSGPGDQSRLYRTTDGCSSWKLLLTNPDARAIAVSRFWDGILFLDRQQGIIYGDPARAAARTDPVRGLLHVSLGDPRRREHWIPVVDPGTVPRQEPAAASRRVSFRRQQQRHGGQPGMDLAGNQQGEGPADPARSFRSGTVRRRNRPVFRQLRDSWMDWQSAQTPLASGNDSSGVFSLAFRDQKHGIAVGGDYRKPNDATGNAAYHLRWRRTLERSPQTTPWLSFGRGLGRNRAGLDNGGQQWLRYLL